MTPDPTPEDARAALQAERARTLARIGAMSAEFDEIVAGSADSNADDEHDPEGSTIAFERAQKSALLEDARAYLDELDSAAARLDDGISQLESRDRLAPIADKLGMRDSAGYAVAIVPRPVEEKPHGLAFLPIASNWLR